MPHITLVNRFMLKTLPAITFHNFSGDK